MVADLMPTCQERNIRGNITVISDRHRSVSMNGKVASDPAICADAERSCVIKRPDNLGIFSDLIADGAKEIPLRSEETCPAQNMIDQVNHDSLFDGLQLHF